MQKATIKELNWFIRTMKRRILKLLSYTKNKGTIAGGSVKRKAVIMPQPR